MCQSDTRMTWKNSIKLSSKMLKGEKINFLREEKWLIELELIYGNNLHQPKVSNRSHFWEQGERNSVFFEFGLLHCNRNWQRRKKRRKNKLTMKDETLTHPKERKVFDRCVYMVLEYKFFILKERKKKGKKKGRKKDRKDYKL